MNLVPGHSFVVANPRKGFKQNYSYTIYYIKPVSDGFEYIFKSGNECVTRVFSSSEHAEIVIRKLSGN